MFALYKKEVRSYFCTPFAYIVSALFLMVFSLSFIRSISEMSSSTLTFQFPAVFYNNFFYFIFLIPLLTMRTFAEERKSHTETLWLSAPIRIWQVVLAKYLAVVTVFGMMLVLSLLYPLITFIKGSVVVSSLLCGYAGFILWGLVCIAIGMLCSAVTDSPILAAVLGEAAMIVVVFLDSFSETNLVQSLPWLSSVLLWFSTQHRFAAFAQGFFSVGDFVFFLSLSAVVLAWIVIVIEKRRWSRG